MAELVIPGVGKTAPNFTLPSSTGGDIELKDIASRNRIVLYFYPKADTSGCTRQACGFRDTAADYKKAGAIVIGVSPDPIENVVKFAKKYKLNFPLLADADHAICEKYGLWQQKSMYGRKYMGVLRTTFIISQGGKIEYVFEKVKPEGHEAEVLKQLAQE